jgi:hypothetical protein
MSQTFIFSAAILLIALQAPNGVAQQREIRFDRNADCTDMTGQVELDTKYPRGPGDCDGKITGYLSNRGMDALVCYFNFYSNGVKKEGGMVNILPFRKVGGEGGGIWSCRADEIRYECFRQQLSAASCKSGN